MSTAAEIYHKGRTYAEHRAWLDALDRDEWLIVYTPPGHLFNLAQVSFWKLALLTIKMSAGGRLKILNGISEAIYGLVTAEAVAAIEPACDLAEKMLREISSLRVEDQMMAFDNSDLFRKLAKLNPSLIRHWNSASIMKCLQSGLPKMPDPMQAFVDEIAALEGGAAVAVDMEQMFDELNEEAADNEDAANLYKAIEFILQNGSSLISKLGGIGRLRQLLMK